MNNCARQLHIIPTDDAVDHDTRYWNACVCGPDVKTHPHDGHHDIIVTHHSLDGREHYEQHL